jgi:two-component system sensor histidine kinase YesM
MVVALLSVIIFGTLITQFYNDAVDKRTRQSVQDSSVVIADRITRVLKDAENCSNYLTVNINDIMDDISEGEDLTLAEQKAVTNELYVAKIVFDEINSIAFLTTNQKIFVSDNNLLTNKEAIFESEQLKRIQGTSGKSIWFPCEARNFLVQDTTVPVLTLGKKVIQINTGETLGYIFLNVDISAIENNLTNQLINYRLVDEKDTVISSVVSSAYIDEEDIRDILKVAQADQVKSYLGRNYYISTYEIANYGWKLVGVTDLNEFNIDTRKIFYLVVAVAAAAVLLELILSNYLSRIITVPLLKLKNGAEEIADGNMKLRLHFKSEDEIGQLGNSFNYMAEQVQELLLKVDYEAKKKREYELSLLHEQVKPHFLYNTLDIIIKLTDMNRNKEARRVVKKLADYYRNSLSDSKEIITIGKEIKIVEDYLELQRIRYNDIFTYEVEIDEDIAQMLIPKLTLQPLVENAIYHGLKYKRETGSLKITGKRTDQCVMLTVEDDGAGMNEETCERMLENDPEGHFGVYSVNHRIKLIFGPEYGLKARSILGEGTTIEILLPAREFMEGLV